MERKHILLLFINILLVSSCSKEENVTDSFSTDLPSVVNSFANGEAWMTTALSYRENLKAERISIHLNGVSNLMFTLHEESNTIVEHYEFLPKPNDTMWTKTYHIEYRENEISVEHMDSGNKMTFLITGNYIDEFSVHGEHDANLSRIAFARDEMDRLISLEYFTNESINSNQEVMIWRYTFSNFTKDLALSSTFNPVYDFPAKGIFPSYISHLLELEISSEVPFTSSLLTGNGHYTEMYVDIQQTIPEANDHPIERLLYRYADIDQDYYLEFAY